LASGASALKRALESPTIARPDEEAKLEAEKERGLMEDLGLKKRGGTLTSGPGVLNGREDKGSKKQPQGVRGQKPP
jgi:hypothetical protein